MMQSVRPLCRAAFLRAAGAVLMAVGGFAAAAADPSPARTMSPGYTQLDWVRSNGRQIVGTGIPVTSETVVEMSFGNVSFTKESVLFGQSWGGDSFMLPLRDKNGVNCFTMFSGNAEVIAYGSMPANADFTVRAGNGQIKVTNVTAGDSKTTDLSAPAGTMKTEISVFDTTAGFNGTHGGAFTFYSMTISGANGELLRDFVPCRNPDGEVGLWDFVSQSFFPNTGAERLFAPGETDVRLTRIKAAKGAYIDTGFKPTSKTRTVMDFIVGGDLENWFGESGGGTGNWYAQYAYAVGNNPDNLYVGFGNNSGNGGSAAHRPAGWRGKVELNGGVYSAYNHGETAPCATFSVTSADFTAKNTMFLFAHHTDSTGNYVKQDNNVTCYGCKVWDNGTPVRDFVPARRADGAIGMIDAVNGDAFYENKGFSSDIKCKMTWDGIAYTLDGTALEVHEGVLAAGDVADFAEVRKVDWFRLDATAVTSYPGALTLAKGIFSLKDGVTRSYSAAGALTLGAGAKLELDVTGEGCDTITAQSVVLSATAANPVDVRVNAVGVSELEPTAKLEVFPNAAFAAGDAEKFTVSGMPVKFVVEDGRLYLVSKDAGEAEWTGEAGDGMWSSAGNWRNGTIPTDGMTVKFNLAAGGVTTYDLAGGHTFKSIVFEENAGAYTIAGSVTIGVTDAVRNESAAAQTISAPCAFGVAGLTFEFACAGDLTFGNATSEVSAETLVKTGAGRLVIADTTLWKAANMTVRQGLLTTTLSGLVSGATPNEGALVIEDGGMLDVNRDLGNSSRNVAGVEAYHGKTVYIAGDGDGRGALYNSRDEDNWGALFGKVVLTDDASVGGNMLTVRQMEGSRITGRGVVEGPYTLTVKAAPSDPSYVRARVSSFYNAIFALDRVDVTGMMCVENDPSGTITNGIHLLDGAVLTFYYVKAPTNCVPVVAEAGSSTLACDYVSTTASDVTVPSGSTLFVDVIKDQTLSLNGTVTVNGVMDKTATAGTALLGGTLSGNGTLRGGSIRFDGANARWTMAADDTDFTSKVDVSGVTDAAFLSALKAIDVTYTGTTRQTLDIGPAFGLTSSEAQNIALNVADGDGQPVADCWLGVADGKLQLHLRETPVATAKWLGGADSALDESSNWECRDKDGNLLRGALPTDTAVVDIPDGCVFNCTNGAPFVCKRLNLPASLAADCDLRGVSSDLSGTVDLKGRKIYLSTTKGEVAFTDGEYVLLESLRAPKGAYIDTGFKPTSKTRTVMDFIVGGSAENWFGESGGGGSGSWYRQLAYAVGNNPDNLYVGFGNNSDNGGPTAHRPTGWRGKVELDGGVYSAYNHGETAPCATFSVTYEQAFTAKNTMFLFAHHTDSTDNYVKADNNIVCFGCQIWDNGTPVRDYVPAQRVSDGVVGMIDRANGNGFNPSSSATAFVAGRVLTAENGGEVHFDIPEGRTETNAGISFKGTVKVVKDGAGTLVMAKTGQAYAGGTEIAAGTLVSGADFSSFPCGASGSDITVGRDAVLDRKGASGLDSYRLVLGGGTLTSSSNPAVSDHTCNIRDLVLTADSRIVFDAALTVSADLWILGDAVWDLNGHVLDIFFDGSDPDVFAQKGMTLRNGTIRTTMSEAGWGWFQDLGINGKDGGCLDLATNLRLRCNGEEGRGTYSTISNLTFRAPKDNVASDGYQMVYGTFTPVTGYAYKIELQDGATVNLGELDDAWSTTPLNGAAATATFADGATILVDMGGRKLKSSEPVITWAAKPANVKFRAVPGTVGRVVARDNGLYGQTGFGIIIR